MTSVDSTMHRWLSRAGAPPSDALAAEVERAITTDELVVHYQPIVDLADNHMVALEALVRWEHPERGLLPPAAFLDAAERSGSIVALGDVVLDKACRQAAAWRRSGADIGLAVNVSARQLADPCLTGRFVEIIRASGFDPARLWLEITETAIVEDLDTVSDALRTLVELGAGVSIDDFGTGWASLTYLRSFPVHTLKIDRSFVAGVGGAGNDTAIVRSILSLATELDLFAVAEGIETREQHEQLRSMGCTLGQGYYFGRPAAAGDVPIERAHRIGSPHTDFSGRGHPAARSSTSPAPVDLPAQQARLLDLAGEGRPGPAIALGLGLLAGGTTFEEIVVDVLAPTQRRVGELWETNSWNVAAEHVATEVVGSVLGATALQTTGHDLDRGMVLVACAEGEQHTMPARMGVELLRADGWQVTFLGASLPADDLGHFAAEREPDAVVISCTVPLFLPGARRCFAAVEALGLPALGAGAAFGADAGRALRLGARGWVRPGMELATLLEDLHPHPLARDLHNEAIALELDREALIDSCVVTMTERLPVMATYSSAQIDSTRSDLAHILGFLCIAVDLDDDDLFETFIDWLTGVLGSRNVPPPVLDASLQIIGEVLNDADMADATRLCRVGRRAIGAATPTTTGPTDRASPAPARNGDRGSR